MCGSRAAVSHEIGGDLQGGGNADIERIFGRNAVLHQRKQRRLGRIGEVGHGRRFHLRIVMQQVNRGARRGHEGDARAPREAAAVEGERGFDEVIERAAVDDAIALAHGEVAGVIAGDGAGMR